MSLCKYHTALIMLISFFLAAEGIYSQSHYLKRFTNDEGLPQSQVYDIFQDGKGYIWVCTGSGLGKFDGKKFVNFHMGEGLTNNTVFCGVEDTSGQIWVGTDNGLNILRKDKIFPVDSSTGTRNVIYHDAAIDSSGNLWFATNRGAIKYDGNKYHFYGREFNLLYVVVDEKNNVWFIAQKEKLLFFRNGKLYDSSEINPDLAKYNFISLGKGENSLWAGTYEGIVEFSGGSLKIRKDFLSLSYSIVVEIMQDRQGKLWLGCSNGDILTWENDKFEMFTSGKGEGFVYIFSLFEDRESNIWFGTDGSGLIKYNRSPFVSYWADRHVGFRSVWSILELDDGTFIIGTESSGLLQLINGTYRTYPGTESIKAYNILAVRRDLANNIWLATYDGFFRLSGNTLKKISLGKEFDKKIVSGLFVDSANNIWVLFLDSGIGKYSPDGKFKFFDNVEGIDIFQVNSIHEDPWGRIIAGTRSGLALFEDDQFIKIPDNSEIKNNIILSLSSGPDGRLWIGTSGEGVYSARLSDIGQVEYFDHLTKKDGLSDDEILSLTFDNSGSLWCGTNRGVNQISINRDKGTTTAFSIRQYSRLDGFSGIECNHNAVFADSKNSIWFGTIRGAIRYVPELEVPNNNPPLIYIDNIRIFSENEDLSRYITDHPGIELNGASGIFPYNKNHLTFDFTGISLRVPEKTLYSVYLEGFDSGWSPYSSPASVTYSNLPPGKYLLNVIAVNSAGIQSENPAKFHFTITPPFWSSSWFLILMTMFTIIIVYGIYFLRVNSLKNREKALKTMVSSRTKKLEELVAGKDKMLSIISHDLKSPFNALLGSSKLLLDEFDSLDEKEQKTLVSNIHFSLKNLFGLTENLLEWSRLNLGRIDCNPVVFDVAEIVMKAHSLSVDMANKKNIKIENKVAVKSFIYADPQMLTSVIHNLLTNAIKFTHNDGTVTIASEKTKENMICISVRDTGVGMTDRQIKRLFDLKNKTVSETGTGQEKGTGLGLIIAKEFIAKNNGTIKVESEQGKGSSFVFCIPQGKPESV